MSHLPLPAKLTLHVALIAAALLQGCQEVRVPGVYRIDIQQGNVITQEQLAALEPGMEKRKVRFILGTPLVADAFNQDRWDYYYSLEKRGEDRVQRVISVFFDKERLVRVGGDVRPASGPIVVESRRDELVAVPEGHRDEGLLAGLTPDFMSRRKKFAGPEPAEPPPAAATDAGTPGSVAAVEPPAAPAVQVDPEDERYLRELLAGFGEDARGAEIAQPAEAQPPAAQGPEPGAEESLFSRWARRLGLKEEDESAPAPPPTVE
jgi:outer membrane protein assembly factor BamE